GDFVSNAQVIVELPQGDPLETTTDSTGNFDMTGIPEGPQVVEIRGDGYSRSFAVVIDKSTPYHLHPADDCNPVDLQQCGFIGHFCAAGGDPNAPGFGNLVGATVTIVRSDGGGETFSDVTDLDGNFEINGLPPANYN